VRLPSPRSTALVIAGAVLLAAGGWRVFAQAQAGPAARCDACGAPVNDLPNPYRTITGPDKNFHYFKLPAGRTWGSTAAVDMDKDGKTIWVAERCGGNSCLDAASGQMSPLDPVLHFDENGNLLKSFGAGLIVMPHGIFVDKDDNIWITDGRADKNKKTGHTVLKLSPDGKVLMTLGTPGVTGEDETHFNAPSDVIVAPNGDIFVADGHGNKTNARIVKFSKDGKFIKAWGKEGKGPGEFDQPHGLAMDSAGRLFVADRANSRLQIFDQDGKFLAEWKQFGRPSGVWIDKSDTIYVADSQSSDKTNPGFKQGIRIGNVKDGKVTAFIEETQSLGALEGVGADDDGNVYAGYTNAMNLKRFVKRESR